MRPTLQNGDIWSEILANASIRPIIDGQDNPGSIALIRDSNFDPAPDQMFSRFYAFYDRVRVQAGTGLQITYTGAMVLTSSGSLVSLNAGNINLPPSSVSYVFINGNGAVAFGNAFPMECIPLAIVTTNALTITNLIDVRNKIIEQVQPRSLPAQASPFITGEIRTYSGSTAPAGWLICNGQTLDKPSYPGLFAVIGYTYGGTGNSFSVPDLRSRVVVGAGGGNGMTNYPLGSTGGAEFVQLTQSHLPFHTHGVVDPGHSHAIYDPGHGHVAIDPGHSHEVRDPGHDHFVGNYRSAALNADSTDGVGAEASTQGEGGRLRAEKEPTGVTVRPSATGIGIQGSFTGVGVYPTGTGVSVQGAGGNGFHENRQPYIALNYIIKT